MFQTNINMKDLRGFYAPGNILGTGFNLLTPEGLIITTVIHHGYSDGGSI